MSKNKLLPLTEIEKAKAEEMHNIVYAFLKQYHYPISEYYNVVIFGFLKGIQAYYRRKDLREKFDPFYICWQYMRTEMENHFRTIKAQKRVPVEKVISLDMQYAADESFYNCIGGNSADSNLLEVENVLELFSQLNDIQGKIAKMKMDGYSNKEVYILLDMKPSTYYKELQKMKAVVESMR